MPSDSLEGAISQLKEGASDGTRLGLFLILFSLLYLLFAFGFTEVMQHVW